MIRSRLAAWVVCVLVGGFVTGCGEAPTPDADVPRPARHSSGVLNAEELPHQTGEAAPPVRVTPRAAAAVREALSETDAPGDYYLRLSVTPGGCSGFMNKLDLDPNVTAEDVVFESDGLKIAVARKQFELVRGSLVDHVEEKGQIGFKITNPKREAEAAKKPCPVPEGSDDNEGEPNSSKGRE